MDIFVFVHVYIWVYNARGKLFMYVNIRNIDCMYIYSSFIIPSLNV